MNVRNLTSADMAVVGEWWKAHQWPIMPEEFLPKTALIVDNVCAGFLYKTDSKIAWLEFVISNPNVDKEVRAQGLDLVIDGLINLAKEQGFKTIFTSVSHPKLIERYKEHGFNTGDTNMTNLVRGI